MGAFFMPKNIYGKKGGIYGIYGIQKIIITFD